MTAPLTGRFNDGRSAASRRVTVLALPDGLNICDDTGDVLAFWHRDDLREECGGETVLRLRSVADEDARLAVDNGAALRPLLPARRPERGGLRLGLALAAAAAMVGGLWIGLPAGARVLAAMVPASVEHSWGDRMATGIEAQWPRCRQPAGEAALADLTERLAAGLPPDARPRRVIVVKLPQVNAIALPGGNVIVFSGLLASAAGADELAGVLAHEFTHVRLRHPLAGTVRAMGVGILVTLVTGDTSGLLATASSVALAGAYSREDESAADAGAAELLARVGMEGQGLAAFFRKLEAPGLMPAWLSTHPDPEMRARAMDALARPGAPALTESQWQALKAICA